MLASKLHVKRSLFTNLLENIKYIVLFVTETLIYVWPRNLNLEYTTHKMYMGTMYREYDLLLFFLEQMYTGSITVFVWVLMSGV